MLLRFLFAALGTILFVPQAHCAGADAPTEMLAALSVDDGRFDELARRTPAIAEAITWISAVPGGRGGPFDLRALDAMSLGEPSYARAWASRRETSGKGGTESVAMPDWVTVIKGAGLAVPGQEGVFIFTLETFRSAQPGTVSEDALERVNLVLMASRERFPSSVTEDSVPIYEVIDVEFPGSTVD